MKTTKLKKLIKERPLYVFTILYLLISGVVVYFVYSDINSRIKQKIEYRDRIVTDKNGKKHYQIPSDYHSIKEQNKLLKIESDNFRDLMGSKDAKINALTEIKGKLSDTLKLVAIKLDEANHKIWNFEKTYKSGTKFTAVMNEKDSTLIPRADLRLKVYDIQEGKGKNKRFYTDISTEDENFTIEGAKVLRKERKEIRDIYSLNFKNDLYFDFRAMPSFYKSEIELQLFPDGKVVPKVGAGGILFFGEKPKIFWKVGVDIPISQIKY